MDRYDVVVIGAGLAGLETARRMASEGLRVLLADRKASLTDGIATTGIFVRRTLEDFDVPADCLGPAIGRVKLYSPARRVQVLESDAGEFRVARMGRLYARWLERCLLAGVSWSPQTKYLGLEQTRNGSRLRLERLGGPFAVEARLVVGADGARSRVARDLGLSRNREWIFGLEDVFENVPPVWPAELHCFLDPALAPGYLAWCVNDGHEAHIGVGGYASRFVPAAALARFRQSLTGIANLENAARVERRGGWIPVGGILQHIANQRGLLVGDAAGAPSPLTAGGLDPCLRLSALAAHVASDFLLHGNHSAIGAYSGRRFRARFLTRIWMRRVIALLESRPLLEAACALMRQPILHQLAWSVFFGRGSFPDVGRLPARAFELESLK